MVLGIVFFFRCALFVTAWNLITIILYDTPRQPINSNIIAFYRSFLSIKIILSHTQYLHEHQQKHMRSILFMDRTLENLQSNYFIQWPFH